VLCFSDDGPDTGPHPVSQEEIRAAFHPNHGWNVASIEPDRIQTRFHDDPRRTGLVRDNQTALARGSSSAGLIGPRLKAEEKPPEDGRRVILLTMGASEPKW